VTHAARLPIFLDNSSGAALRQPIAHFFCTHVRGVATKPGSLELKIIKPLDYADKAHLS
jgi:hypothetical protein